MSTEPLPGSSSEPVPASAEMTAAEAAAVPAESVPADAVTAEPASTAAAPAPTAGPATVAPAVSAPARLRSARAVAGLRRLINFAIMVALLVGGVAIGYRSFQAAQPPAPLVGDPVTADVPPPPVVAEFVTALASNDADAIRSAVPTDPYKELTSELQRWGIATVTSIQTLSTFNDGPRSSTAIVLIGTSTQGNSVNINLNIQADAGKIVSFR